MPQTRSPKPEDYIVVDGSDGPRRDFRISVGLREGWDPDGRVFDVSEAVRGVLALGDAGGKRQRLRRATLLRRAGYGLEKMRKYIAVNQEIVLGLPHEQFCPFAFQDRRFGSLRCEFREKAKRKIFQRK